MNLLNAHGYSVSHGRALLMETALANAVVENTRAHQGLYVPPFLRKGTFVFFAADNTDFAEDTRDGKGTTHGTITAVYQKIDPSKEPVAEPLIIGDAQSLSVTPYHVDILHCDKPTPQHAKRSEQFAISRGISESYQLTHLGWVVASALSRMKAGETYINNTVDLKETKDLFARLMVLARSNRDINQKEAIGNYEFTLTPRALFASNGKILPCHDKSKLISLLEKLTREDVPHEDHQLPQTGSTTHQDAMDTGFIDTTSTDQPSRKIALVDGMVLVQRLSKKPATVVTVKDLSGCFNDRLMSLSRDYDEIILVFDTYRTDSLKSATRDKRRQGKAIQYQVRDDTNIKHIPLSRFLSHDQTKADLTDYLAAKILEYNRGSSKLIITSASGNTRSNKDLLFEENNQEEADTLLIHQAVLASHRNPADAQFMFFSPDTDILTLSSHSHHITAAMAAAVSSRSRGAAGGLILLCTLLGLVCTAASLDENRSNNLKEKLQEIEQDRDTLKAQRVAAAEIYNGCWSNLDSMMALMRKSAEGSSPEQSAFTEEYVKITEDYMEKAKVLIDGENVKLDAKMLKIDVDLITLKKSIQALEVLEQALEGLEHHGEL
ncbi:hypothetical protein CgunFtcFv8_006920 [Champsocephalus gunnari]|uniref:Uncharacterized protein n=1 Tax=Champsocephalus gunnari TaxID=52237 RepID=A0AAN8H5D9_CHAGU|nr:hypothetical protein CgunFtcFv8_006920 [Champsocephalus gunnari]